MRFRCTVEVGKKKAVTAEGRLCSKSEKKKKRKGEVRNGKIV